MSMEKEVDKLVALADRCGVTMYAACKRSGVEQVTVMRWKNGTHSPSMVKYYKVRDAVIAIAKERKTLPEGVE